MNYRYISCSWCDRYRFLYVPKKLNFITTRIKLNGEWNTPNNFSHDQSPETDSITQNKCQVLHKTFLSPSFRIENPRETLCFAEQKKIREVVSTSWSLLSCVVVHWSDQREYLTKTCRRLTPFLLRLQTPWMMLYQACYIKYMTLICNVECLFMSSTSWPFVQESGIFSFLSQGKEFEFQGSAWWKHTINWYDAVRLVLKARWNIKWIRCLSTSFGLRALGLHHLSTHGHLRSFINLISSNCFL